MFRLYRRHLGSGWHRLKSATENWKDIDAIDDGELWETHLALKSRLLKFARRRSVVQAERRGAPAEELERLSRVLSPDALTIGFARRFATYKRADLILSQIEELEDMVNDPRRPVQFVFAGKAHPLDEPGKRVLQKIARLTRDPRFADRIVFIEDYDINVGRYLVQGVDVWLNTPRRPMEASGTSGPKVVMNGGLNLSVLDGWWVEAHDGNNGFSIGPDRGMGRRPRGHLLRDRRDGHHRDADVLAPGFSETGQRCPQSGTGLRPAFPGSNRNLLTGKNLRSII
jgi:starch phosphorylase